MELSLKYLLAILLSMSVIPSDAENIILGNFSSASLKSWESKKLSGLTNYQLISEQGKTILKAYSFASASALLKEQRIDLHKTPYLNWSWRINNTLGNLNEQSKQGDDYAARVYIIVSGNLAFWKTRSINYVWASHSVKGHVWENAFAGKNVKMIALQSKESKLKYWYQEKRNIYQDLKQQFGEKIRYIDAIAIMTDTDNSGGTATAFYGDIYFTEQ